MFLLFYKSALTRNIGFLLVPCINFRMHAVDKSLSFLNSMVLQKRENFKYSQSQRDKVLLLNITDNLQ